MTSSSAPAPDDSPHRIRLRRPWSRCWTDRPAAVDRVDVPDEVVHRDVAATLRYVRNFNRPGGETFDEAVWLVIGGWSGDAVTVSINGQDVNRETSGGRPGDTSRLEITGRLQSGNQIVIELRGRPGQSIGLTGGVWLEIGQP